MDLLTLVAFIFSAIGAAAVFFDKRTESKASIKNKQDDSVKGSVIIVPKGIRSVHRHRESLTRTQVVGIILILSCSALWGVEHLLAKTIVTEFSNPISIVAWRQVATALFIGIFALIIKPFSKNKLKTIPLHFDKDAILMILGRGMAGVFYMLALTYLNASTTIVLYKLSGLFAFIFTIYMLAGKLPKFSVGIVISGLICSVLGVIAASFISGVLFGGNSLVGYLFAVLAPFCWALFLVHSERHKSSGLANTDLYLRTLFLSKIIAISSLVPILVLFVLSFLGEVNNSGQSVFLLPVETFIKITMLGLVQAGTAILYFESVKRISSVFVSVLVSAEILATILLEKMLYDLQLDSHIIIATILMTLGAYLVSTESNKFKLSE